MINIVIVEWEDSRQPVSEWAYAADYEAASAVPCVSVGWLIKDSKDVKVLAQNMGDIDDKNRSQVSGVMQIPARCVIRITPLVKATSSSEGPSSHPD